MPELPRTRTHLETGLGNRRWSGYALSVRLPHAAFHLVGGDVPDTSSALPWFSAGKPVTAAGVLKILEQQPSLRSLPMAETLPELRGFYSGTLTLESILTHQTGLRLTEAALGKNPGETIRHITPEDCNLTPGQAAYDPAGGWWLLGQWIQRHTKKPWAEFLENDLLGPAGITELKFEGPTLPIRERRGRQWLEGEPGSGPGAGLTGPASGLSLFYERLQLGYLLHPDSRKAMLRPMRQGRKDATFGAVLDFGLGVILRGNHGESSPSPYGFGPGAGAGAFGHGGARSSIAFADPESGFCAAVFLNGRVPESEHQPRMHALLDELRSELAEARPFS